MATETIFADPRRIVEKFGLMPGMKVADFGSGSGHYTLAAARLISKEGTMYAIDIQRDLLRKVKNLSETQQQSNIEVIWGDFERKNGTTLSDNSIDAVIVSNVLFQIEEKDALVEEAYRILRPNGRVFVIDWKDSYKSMGPVPHAVVTEMRARQLFEEGKFQYERSFDAGSHHYGIVVRKA
jgi:ubiquinone/menaquinone biosynthesis C-methylase UbiE